MIKKAFLTEGKTLKKRRFQLFLNILFHLLSNLILFILVTMLALFWCGGLYSVCLVSCSPLATLDLVRVYVDHHY